MEKRKILIVDDSWVNRQILSGILDEEEYQILEAENGLQAIAVMEKQGQELSLILLDIVMPECDGYGVLSYMSNCRLSDDLPVIVISSETDQSCINRAYDMGAVDFISRPFDAHVVKRRIKNTISLYERQKKMSAIVAEEIHEKTKSYDRMVSILSQIVEFRNQESGLHVFHIRRITEMLANQLLKKTDHYRLKNSDVQVISMASSLHDIGKITIPDEILNKPGRLTPEEFEVIKTHSTAGASMIERLFAYQDDPMINTARDICRWHHERYDGKGYPDGLTGDELPVSAQIVSLADVYDALTSERCYKKAFSHEEALKMILNGECGEFNPLLLECLLDISDRLPEELKKNYEEDREKQELSQLTEEVSQHEELTVSNRVLRRLQFEQSRADFFEAETGNMTFVYRKELSTLFLSDGSAELLGMKKVVSDPACDEIFCRHAGIPLGEWRKRQSETSPKCPDFLIDGHIAAKGRNVCCRFKCHSVWASGETPQYLGIVGTVAVL